MTSTSRSHPKSFSSFLLTGAILTVSLLAFVPVALGQAENPGGDTVSKELVTKGIHYTGQCVELKF